MTPSPFRQPSKPTSLLSSNEMISRTASAPRSLLPRTTHTARATLHHRRAFFNLPTNDTQTITATRTLPYPQQALYKLISDVDSYSSFVPYCSHSRVTQWSPPDQHGRRWPTSADLHVGWGGFDEVFTSQLRCVPDESVEAVSGADVSAVFKSLVTRWQLSSSAQGSPPMTEVHLTIRYQFINPLYAAVSAAMSDKVAGLMIEAFERRASEELGRLSRP